METVLQDLKQAVRGLGKNTGALVTAVLTLAVGARSSRSASRTAPGAPTS